MLQILASYFILMGFPIAMGLAQQPFVQLRHPLSVTNIVDENVPQLFGTQLKENVLSHEVKPNFEILFNRKDEPSKCQNIEALLNVLNRLLAMLSVNLKNETLKLIKVNDMLNLIKKFIEESPNGLQNSELNSKLKFLERQLDTEKQLKPFENKPVLRQVVDDHLQGDLQTNIIFKYKLPSISHPHCKEALMKLIEIAHKAYLQLAEHPMCNGNPNQNFPNKSIVDDIQNPYNTNNVHSALFQRDISDADTPYTMNVLKISNTKPQNNNIMNDLSSKDLNKNTIISLLQNYRPIGNFNLNWPVNQNQAQLNLEDNPVVDPYFRPRFSNLPQLVPTTIGAISKPNILSGRPISGFDLIDNDTQSNVNSVMYPLDGKLAAHLEHAKSVLEKNYKNVISEKLKSGDALVSALNIDPKLNPKLFDTNFSTSDRNPLYFSPNKTGSKNNFMYLFPGVNPLFLINPFKNVQNEPSAGLLIGEPNRQNNNLIRQITPSMSQYYDKNYANIGSLNPYQNGLLNRPGLQNFKNPYTNQHQLYFRGTNPYAQALYNMQTNKIPLNQLQSHNINQKTLGNLQPNTQNLLLYPQKNLLMNSKAQKNFNRYPMMNTNLNTQQHNPILINNEKSKFGNFGLYNSNPNQYSSQNGYISPDVTPYYGKQANYDGGVKPVDRNQMASVANSYKLDAVPNINGIIELTYLLKRPNPLIYQPYYYVKYRLPYTNFVNNMKTLLVRKPYLRAQPLKLYQELITDSNITDISPDLKDYDKKDVLKLLSQDGALVKAKVMNNNDTVLNEQLRKIQDLNSHLQLDDLINTFDKVIDFNNEARNNESDGEQKSKSVDFGSKTQTLSKVNDTLETKENIDSVNATKLNAGNNLHS